MRTTEPGSMLFDRYHVVRRIAAGGMGTVFEARDLVLDQPVALKRVSYAALPEELAAETRERTLREARNAAQMRGDPHVVAIYDVQVSDDDVWLVLEYLPSRSLAELTAGRTKLDARTVAAIGAPVARGLAAAHGRGITHRDVKPGNILIATGAGAGAGAGADQGSAATPPGAVKLTDFGISHAEGESTLTATGQVSGTPAYMAREVARGEDATPASDVFSLGATLYAAVEGIGPFGAQSNPRAMVYRVANDPVRPPEVAGPLAPMLMAMMADEPSRRPGATTVAGWLETVATRTEGSSSRAPSAPVPPGPAAAPESPRGGTVGASQARPGAAPHAAGAPPSAWSALPAGQRPSGPPAPGQQGSAQQGSAQQGSAQQGSAQQGSARQGSARQGSQAWRSPSGLPAPPAGGRGPGPSTPHPGAAVAVPPEHPARAAGGHSPAPGADRPAGPSARSAPDGAGQPAPPGAGPAGQAAPPGPAREAGQPVPQGSERAGGAGSPGPGRRRRTPLLVGGAVGAVLVVVLGVVGFQVLTPSDEPPPAAAPSPRAISGDPRTADPCPLLDPAALQRFGGVNQVAAGPPSGCRVDVTASDGKPAQLTASFSRGVTVDGGTQQAGDLTLQRGRTETGEGSRSCTHSLGLPDGNQVLLRAYSFTPGIPPCDLADQGLDSAVSALQRDGVRYDPNRNQGVVLARADACQGMDAAALGRVGIGATAFPGYASWSCSWGTSDNYASVSFGSTTARTGVAGAPGPPIAGRKSWVDGQQGTCSVTVAHREGAGQDDLMETVTTTVQIAGADRDRACATATDLATTAESRLPSE